MQKLDKIKDVKVADQSIEVDPRSKQLTTTRLIILVQENLKCQLAVRKECYQKRKETLRRTKLCGYRQLN